LTLHFCADHDVSNPRLAGRTQETTMTTYTNANPGPLLAAYRAALARHTEAQRILEGALEGAHESGTDHPEWPAMLAQAHAAEAALDAAKAALVASDEPRRYYGRTKDGVTEHWCSPLDVSRTIQQDATAWWDDRSEACEYHVDDVRSEAGEELASITVGIPAWK
jgi:hypothetical protein